MISERINAQSEDIKREEKRISESDQNCTNELIVVTV